MIVSAVAAMAQNRVIGVDNKLPWHIPEDLQFFKTITSGKIMIMGRKTFESIGRPLPKRFHIVVSRNPEFHVDHPMVCVVSSLEAGLSKARELAPLWNQEVCIVGGGEIYKQSLPFLDRIYLTLIEKDYPGDAKFPEFDTNQFVLRSREARVGDPPFSFCVFEKP